MSMHAMVPKDIDIIIDCSYCPAGSANFWSCNITVNKANSMGQ